MITLVVPVCSNAKFSKNKLLLLNRPESCQVGMIEKPAPRMKHLAHLNLSDENKKTPQQHAPPKESISTHHPNHLPNWVSSQSPRIGGQWNRLNDSQSHSLKRATEKEQYYKQRWAPNNCCKWSYNLELNSRKYMGLPGVIFILLIGSYGPLLPYLVGEACGNNLHLVNSCHELHPKMEADARWVFFLNWVIYGFHANSSGVWWFWHPGGNWQKKSTKSSGGGC